MSCHNNNMSLPEESGVLSHNVHDVGGNDCLVVFASLDLTQSQEILPRQTQNFTNSILTCNKFIQEDLFKIGRFVIGISLQKKLFANLLE